MKKDDNVSNPNEAALDADEDDMFSSAPPEEGERSHQSSSGGENQEPHVISKYNIKAIQVSTDVREDRQISRWWW